MHVCIRVQYDLKHSRTGKRVRRCSIGSCQEYYMGSKSVKHPACNYASGRIHDEVTQATIRSGEALRYLSFVNLKELS